MRMEALEMLSIKNKKYARYPLLQFFMANYRVLGYSELLKLNAERNKVNHPMGNGLVHIRQRNFEDKKMCIAYGDV